MEEWHFGLDVTENRLLKLYDFISRYKRISDSHSVDYFTENHWRHLIPDEWKIDLLSLHDPELFLYPDRLNSSVGYPLKEFLCSIQELKLLSSHQTQAPPLPSNNDPNCIDQFGMTHKKSHEVRKMSEYIKSIASPLGIKQVIDIGSGKGYLSEYLSFCYKFNVIGIESQSVTTNSAVERCRKVEKLFKGFKERMYRESDSNIQYPSDETIFQENLELTFEPTNTNSTVEQITTDSTVEPSTTDCTVEQITTDYTVEQITTDYTVEQITTDYTVEPSTTDCTVEQITTDSTVELVITDCTVEQITTDYTVEPVTTDYTVESITTDYTVESSTTDCTVEQITTDSTVEPVTTDCTVGPITEGKSSSILFETLTRSYVPVTHCLNMDDDIIKITAKSSLNYSQSIALVGLHTCGDLASYIIKQFVQQNVLQVLCVVGCCYHHITEKNTDDTMTQVGFPISNWLKKHGAVLGRNSRMLSCQNEAQLCEITSGKALQSIFYRAVLQVILQKEMKLIQSEKDARELCVGRIKKYNSFIDYTKRALISLGIPVESHPSNEVIEEYYHYYVPRLTELQRYLQVRAVIAPLIESLILLDRLLFLLEHKRASEIEDAWLCQLFCPSISPRCIAVCAIKKTT